MGWLDIQLGHYSEMQCLNFRVEKNTKMRYIQITHKTSVKKKLIFKIILNFRELQKFKKISQRKKYLAWIY